MRRYGSRTLAGVLAALAWAIIAACPRAEAVQDRAVSAVRIEGRVTDEAGAGVAGAEVTASAGDFSASRTTDGRGEFVFEAVPAGRGMLTVRAPGFESAERAWEGAGGVARVEVGLAAAGVSEEIVVTASRVARTLSDTPSSVVVLSKRELDATAAVTLDDALRQVPGFSLFRRSGSRVANPTAQGASLRGVAPSGASRVAVLADGVPLNDPFGGWVYWGRIPREEIARVEVLRGAASSLYGTDALGGVVNVITARPSDRPAFSLETSYGSQRSAQLSLAASAGLGPWRGGVSLETFDTEGYVLVSDAERGPVDTPAGGGRTAVAARVERDVGTVLRVFARGSLFGESRENGTALQTNRTHVREVVAGADADGGPVGGFAVRAFASAQVYDQTFSAISADRASESLTRSQRVPAQQIGATAQWARQLGGRAEAVAGLDVREVRGASDEIGFFAGRETSALGAGGRRRDLGVFGEVTLRPVEGVRVGLGGRFDRWRNFDARSTLRPLSTPGPTAVTTFDDRSESAFSPRGSLLVKVSRTISLVASGYRAFRAPTLNELYRGFRVGDVVTLANEALRAERLTGAEAGVDVAAADGRIDARAVVYWADVTRPVANVTLDVAPGLITRRRQNLGRTRARGVELDIQARLRWGMVVTAGYAFADSRVVRFEANPSLEGLRVPQVPAHTATVQLLYSGDARLTVGLQGRAASAQYDDDQNRLRLGGFGTLDGFASYRVAEGVEAFAAVENVFDRRYDVGRTPVLTVGPPVTARFGLRLRFGGR